MRILVTGGAGYIGSHTVLELLDAGYDVVVVDNLSSSKEISLQRVAQLAGRPFAFHHVDLRDGVALNTVFEEHAIDAVIHFAGLKAVGESVLRPLEYYENNLISTLRLCEVMTQHQVKKLVFSSSAAVYGEPHKVPITEAFPRSATSPYGMTKLMIEDILADLAMADGGWQVSLLRYFNPVGAHESGLIGEDPMGAPNNLLPYVSQVAVGKLPRLRVFGNDYPTLDGTGVRDYIHVVDLAKGHLAALRGLHAGVEIYNLGSGKGYSVLQLVEAFSKASSRPIPYEIVARRPGDVAVCFANPAKANRTLGWKTTLSLAKICEDAWRWQIENPNGYEVHSVRVNKHVRA